MTIHSKLVDKIGGAKMQNKLLEKMFEMSRWEALIEKADRKGIDKGELRKMCLKFVWQFIKQSKMNNWNLCPATWHRFQKTLLANTELYL